MYNVLWIDDQCNDQELKQFIIKAYNNGIKLDGYPSYEEGFEVLENNLEKYDVILLDGMFFEKKGQQKGTEDESGLGMAIGKINELKNRKVFPWFVLSGKESFTRSENLILKVNKASCFNKSKSSDVLQLFEEIKEAAKTQSDFQLKHQYNNILEICVDKYVGTNQFERVFSLIKDLENKDGIEKTRDLLNPIRKIIEALFCSLRDIGIIPREVKSLNRSSLFLANKHDDYTHFSEFIHPMVAENLYRLINITQDGSHGEGELKLRVDEYLQNNNTDFLYKSTVYLLFDILMWFIDFIDRNGDVEANKMLWEKILFVSENDSEGLIHGVVINMNFDKGYAFFKPNDVNEGESVFIPPHLVRSYDLQDGIPVKAKKEEYICERTKIQKTRIKRIEVI